MDSDTTGRFNDALFFLPDAAAKDLLLTETDGVRRPFTLASGAHAHPCPVASSLIILRRATKLIPEQRHRLVSSLHSAMTPPGLGSMA